MELEQLQSLRDRVANAAGPDREIDAALCEVFCLHPAGTERVMNTDGASTAWAGNAIWWEALPLTASIDAALGWVERVLPGWGWSVERRESDFIATVWDTDEYEVRAPTPTLAIILAGLDALIEKENADGTA